jgi:hypothetical protein
MNRVQGEWAVTKTTRLSKRYSVDLTLGPGGFCCEWSPHTPAPRSLTGKEVARYRRARDALVAEVSERIGGSVLVVEV